MKGKHFDTSAKTGKGIEELFTEITRAILKRAAKKKKGKKGKGKKQVEMPKGYDLNMNMGEGGGYGGVRLSQVIIMKSSKKEKSGGCCKGS